MTDPRRALAQATLGRYEIGDELARGGMGYVFSARDLLRRRAVAVKVLRPEFGLVARLFLREIQIVASLHHPNVVPLLDSGEADGLPFYVMPLIGGVSLRAHLDSEPRLAVDDALAIVGDLADALSYAHEHDIVHRDVKPENVMLTGRRAMLLDFGVARAIEAADSGRVTSSGLIRGTPRYMSPEQWFVGRVDARADIYSLGCLTYELLAGEPAFDGPDLAAVRRKHLEARPPTITGLREDIPGGVQPVLDKAMAKDAGDRFASARAFSAALRAAVDKGL